MCLWRIAANDETFCIYFIRPANQSDTLSVLKVHWRPPCNDQSRNCPLYTVSSVLHSSEKKYSCSIVVGREVGCECGSLTPDTRPGLLWQTQTGSGQLFGLSTHHRTSLDLTISVDINYPVSQYCPHRGHFFLAPVIGVQYNNYCGLLF